MNKTLINDILSPLLPRINAANNMPHPVIDVFGAMGGTSGLECGYGEEGGAGRGGSKGGAFMSVHSKCVGSRHAGERRAAM